MNIKSKLTRRHFLGGAAAATACTIVPRHVLGGQLRPERTPPIGSSVKFPLRLSQEREVRKCEVATDSGHASSHKYRLWVAVERTTRPVSSNHALFQIPLGELSARDAAQPTKKGVVPTHRQHECHAW